MKILKTLGGLLLLLVVAGTGFMFYMGNAISPTTELGTTTPDVALSTLDGADLPLASLRGKVVLLDFWGST